MPPRVSHLLVCPGDPTVAVEPMSYHIDLHCHSYFSADGVSSLEDLIASARAKGLHGFAITDHNTCDAVDYLLSKNLIRPSMGFSSFPAWK